MYAVAPELVLWSAYEQWQNARILCRKLKELGEDELEKPLAQRLNSAGQTNSTRTESPSISELQLPEEETVEIPAAARPDSSEGPDMDQRAEPDSTIKCSPPASWCNINMVLAFYIVMGGFVYDVSDNNPRAESHHSKKYVTLTPLGFLYYAKKGLITADILNNNESIADRSKADSLGKLLVCV